MAMAFQYYAFKNTSSEERHDFDDAEAIVNFFNTLDHHEGELYLNGYIGLKIKYNLETGHVKPVSTQIQENVTNIYSKKAFENVVIPIIDAICLFAKVDLLSQLNKLCDTGISSIISKCHLNESGKFVNINHIAIDHTLFQIQMLARPSLFSFIFKTGKKNDLHNAVAMVLEEIGLSNIKAGKHVAQIMKKIRFITNKISE